MSAGTVSRSFFDAAGRRYAPVAAILFCGVEPVVSVSIGEERGTRQWSRGTHWGEMAVRDGIPEEPIFIWGI